MEIENPKGFGRIWLKHGPDVTAERLLPFIDDAIEPGSSVLTDGGQAYGKLPDRASEHERTVMRQQAEPARVVMPGVHRVATFRFNRRRSRRRGMLFDRLREQTVAADPITDRSLVVNPTPTGRRSARPSSPGRVATVPAVHHPGRKTPEPRASLTQMDNPFGA